ncbi:hypothetical protein TNCV_2704801 [Trichonephila clavipes]|nr:hypothetical protein TNCV_2704801 [Trichonephila clavipes]
MNEDRTTKKVFNARPIDTRIKGRPNLRWIDGLEKDLLVLRILFPEALRKEAWLNENVMANFPLSKGLQKLQRIIIEGWNEDIMMLDEAFTYAKLLDIMIVQFRNEKVSNHGSIPITIDCNVMAFIVFEEVRTNDSTSPIKRTKQSVFLDVTVFRHTLVD